MQWVFEKKITRLHARVVTAELNPGESQGWNGRVVLRFTLAVNGVRLPVYTQTPLAVIDGGFTPSKCRAR